jgi:hypothetical protein
MIERCAAGCSCELFHRIQPGLGLMAPGSGANVDLDSLEGRHWMRLEWRTAGALRLTTVVVTDDVLRPVKSLRSTFAWLAIWKVAETLATGHGLPTVARCERIDGPPSLASTQRELWWATFA